MKPKQNHLTQQLKKSVRDSFSSLHESEKILRDAQSLLREIDTIEAWRPDPLWLLQSLYWAVRYRNLDLLKMASSNVTRWAGFWIKMFFRWLYDEVVIMLFHFFMMILIVLAQVAGIALVLALLYFILTY